MVAVPDERLVLDDLVAGAGALRPEIESHVVPHLVRVELERDMTRLRRSAHTGRRARLLRTGRGAPGGTMRSPGDAGWSHEDHQCCRDQRNGPLLDHETTPRSRART